MRLLALGIFALLGLLVFPSSALALSWPDGHEDQRDLDFFVHGYLKQGETFTVGDEIALGKFYYAIITVNKSEELLVRLDRRKEPTQFELVTARWEAGAVLEHYYGLRGLDKNNIYRLIHVDNGVRQFFHSREVGNGEEMCLHLTGSDEHPCYDNQSCFQACLIPPVCQPMAYGGGWPFLSQIVAFNYGYNRLNELEKEYPEILARALADKNESSWRSYEKWLTEVNVEATKLNQNLLVGGYYFCPEPGFDMNALTEAKMHFFELDKELRPVLQEGERAGRMVRNAEGRELTRTD